MHLSELTCFKAFLLWDDWAVCVFHSRTVIKMTYCFDRFIGDDDAAAGMMITGKRGQDLVAWMEGGGLCQLSPGLPNGHTPPIPPISELFRPTRSYSDLYFPALSLSVGSYTSILSQSFLELLGATQSYWELIGYTYSSAPSYPEAIWSFISQTSLWTQSFLSWIYLVDLSDKFK